MNSMIMPPQALIDTTTNLYTMTNTSASPNWSSSLPTKTLAEVNQEKAQTLLPACIFLASLAIFGLIGNSLVCYVFGARLRPGTQNSLIVCLAVFDLLSCALGIPNEIVDMQLYFTYSSEAACKIMRFINMFTALGSVLTLLFIAIDRYRKVCLPFKRQLHMHHMKVFVVPVIMGGALFLAWPSLLVYGLRSADTGYPGLKGRDCSASEALRGTLVPLIYNSVLFGGFIIIVVALACLYIKVLRGVRRLKKNRQMRRNRNAGVPTSSVGSYNSNPNPRRGKDTRRMKNQSTQRDYREDCGDNDTEKTETQPRAAGVKDGSENEEGKEGDLKRQKSCSFPKHSGSKTGLDYFISNGCAGNATLYEGVNKHKDTPNVQRSGAIPSHFHVENLNYDCLGEKRYYQRKCSADAQSQTIGDETTNPNREDLHQKDFRLIKCSRKPFKRQMSFPLTRTYERFGDRDYTSYSGPPEKLDISPLIKILRKNISSNAHITDYCPILQSSSREESIPSVQKARHINKSYSILKAKKKQGIFDRPRKNSEIQRGEAIGLEDMRTLALGFERSSFIDFQELRNPSVTCHNVEAISSNQYARPRNGLNRHVLTDTNTHKQSENTFLSQIYESDNERIPKPCSQDNVRERHSLKDQSKCGQTYSSLRKNKMLRFSIDPPKHPPSPDSVYCEEKREGAHGALNMTALNPNEESRYCMDNNIYREEYDSKINTQGFHHTASESTHSRLPTEYNDSQSLSSCTKRTTTTTSRMFRPLVFSRAGRKFQSMCPPSSVLEPSTGGLPSKLVPRTSTSKLAAGTETTATTAASRSSFALSVASSCTLDSHYSHYSRISSSPPDDIERSTSSSATLSNHSRHRHNDSRKLRGHRGHGPRSRTTTIALLVTLIFVASFLPHLCLQAAQLINERFASNLKGSASLAYNTFLRSYFINSAANPVLYGILNVKFSAEVRALMGRG